MDVSVWFVIGFRYFLNMWTIEMQIGDEWSLIGERDKSIDYVPSMLSQHFFGLLARDKQFIYLNEHNEKTKWWGAFYKSNKRHTSKYKRCWTLTITSMSSFFTCIFCSSCSLANFSAASLFRLSPKILIACAKKKYEQKGNRIIIISMSIWINGHKIWRIRYFWK